MRRLALAAAAVLLTHAAASTALAQGTDSTKAKPAADAAKAPVTAEWFVGKWRGSVSSPNGDMPVNCEIKKAGSGYVGTISGLEGDVPLREIVIAGDTATAGTVMSMQGTSFEVWYSFVRKADTLTGSASATFNGESMSFPMTLTRVREP
jgi:hypothetical protein